MIRRSINQSINHTHKETKPVRSTHNNLSRHTQTHTMDPDGSIISSSRSNDVPASTSATTKEQEQALLFSFIRHQQWKKFEDHVRSKIDTTTPHTLWTARVDTEEDCQFFGIPVRDDVREDDNDGDENENENLTLLNALLLCKHNNRGSSTTNATARNSSNSSSSLEVPPLSTIQCLIERTDEYVEEQRQKPKQRDSSKATTADEIMPLVALTTNEYQDTPLHQVCATMAERTDIVKYLISKYPDAVCKKNNLYYRPVDIMSNRIIMLEEVMKYNNHSNNNNPTGSTSNRTTSASTNTSFPSSSNHTNAVHLTNEMDRMWKTVSELAKAAVYVTATAVNADTDTRDERKLKTEASQQQQKEGKELFTFIKCPEFPICLFQRALKRYSQQLLSDVDNSVGKNRLLHFIIQNNPQNRRPSTRNNNGNGNDSESDDSDEDEDNDTNNRELFPYILKADPKAASVMNGHNQIPLKLAIHSGYSLSSTTIQSLIKTYPEGLNMLELPSNIIPKVLERFVGESKTTAATTTTTRFRTTDSQRRDMSLIVFKYLRSANASSSTTSKRKSKGEEESSK
mmetsp:Transcript_1176/g.2570  ORF Transcript_1176/g.2570 Transcript_1176/m.2570 type:complete len:570 (+) Transcript_1176:409-2118(+)